MFKLFLNLGLVISFGYYFKYNKSEIVFEYIFKNMY